MSFTVPTFDEVRELLLASLSGRIPTANTSQRSSLYKLKSVTGLGLTDGHAHIYQVGQDVMADTAEGVSLVRHASIRGITRKAASGSAADSGLRVFGDINETVPSSEPLTHAPSGLQFETASGGVIPGAGYLDVDVVAVSTGAVTNLEVGQELQFDSTPSGLETTARIVVELTNGQDEELQDALRARVLNRISQPAMGGNRNDYAQWLLEAAAYVDAAYVYPNRNGLGTVDLAALKDGTGAARLLDAGERTAVGAYVATERPVSAVSRMLEVTALATDVEIKIFPESDPAYTFDWDDTTPPAVLTWTAGTRTLQLAAARPVDMTVGDRLILGGSNSNGAESVIESLSGSDSVVLVEAPLHTPVATDPVYSGGPLVQVCRLAVIALMDAFGPANPDATGYGTWEGTLRLSSLFETVQTQTGVLDTEILDPTGNVEPDDPVFPDNDSIELLTPGQILIRADH